MNIKETAQEIEKLKCEIKDIEIKYFLKDKPDRYFDLKRKKRKLVKKLIIKILK